MKKVAIVSCYFQKNYGSMLQAYATQKILDKLNIENETICIDGLNKEIKERKMKYFLSKVLDFDTMKNKWSTVKFKVCTKLNINGFKYDIMKRNQAFESFLPKFRLSERYSSFKDLAQNAENYSAVLVGSDQLWLPSNITADYYTLNWVPDKVNKISYSTSFGVSTLDEKFQKLATKFLKRINHLSVREQAGKELIKEVAGIEAKVVCDPTLLFTGDEWMDIQEEECIVTEPYVVCYFLGNNAWHRKFVTELKQQTGIRVVALQHIDEYIFADNNYKDEALYDINPGQFINLIRNAEYVCTDSFHATVFSITYKKKFFTFSRFKQSRKVSTNSRIDSLFGLLQLQSRHVHEDYDILQCINKEIDYDSVHKELEEFRNKSLAFLKHSFE